MNLTDLTTLELEKNRFTGTIPTWIDQLVNLENLYLNDNYLAGIIPAEITNMTAFWGCSLRLYNNCHIYSDDDSVRIFIDEHSARSYQEIVASNGHCLGIGLVPIINYLLD